MADDSKIELSERWLRRPEVERLLGVRKSFIYANLPPPIRLSAKLVVWPERTVREWMAERERAANLERAA